jgi:hypothetical protein
MRIVTPIGLALIPPQEEQELIRNFVASLELSGCNFGFALHSHASSYPHLSIMQGTFENESEAIEKIAQLDLTTVPSLLTVSYLSVWAMKILFLNFVLPESLLKLHTNAFNAWHPIMSSCSADPQDFHGITSGQRESIKTTGYPFSRNEYIPHITLAHFAAPPLSDAMLSKANNVLWDSLPSMITFERLVAFKVEPLGLCREILQEFPTG